MMKIGILTLNQQLNYGGVLQSYALQHYLTNQGHDTEVITFWLSKNNSYLNRYFFSKSVPLPKRILSALYNEWRKGFVFAEILRTYRTIKFIGRYIAMSQKKYKNLEELKLIDNYRAIIVGSDQVWNPWNGYNNPFLLTGVTSEIKKIAYAPSFGVQELPQDLQDKYKEALSKFYVLSCREQSGVEVIKQLTNINAEWVVDPTLLLSQKEWNQGLDIIPEEKNYVFCYWLGDFTDIIEKLENIAKQENKKIYLLLSEHFLDGNEKNNLNFRSQWRKYFASQKQIKFFQATGPREFVQLLANSNAVISDSFHAMMFAIIYEKPMKIFATSTAGRAQMSDRMVNFCERLKITEVLAGNIQDEWHFANIQNKNLINDELESWIASSKEFLAKCLR